jgi:hypothetical protein
VAAHQEAALTASNPGGSGTSGRWPSATVRGGLRRRRQRLPMVEPKQGLRRRQPRTRQAASGGDYRDQGRNHSSPLCYMGWLQLLGQTTPAAGFFLTHAILHLGSNFLSIHMH